MRPNPETDGETMFIAAAEDLVRNGYAYIEVARTPDGKLGYLYHIPASTVRKTKKDRESTTVTECIVREGKTIDVPYKRNFRRYGMKVDSAATTVYFKEFKDPRTIDKRDGRKATNRLARNNVANEIIEFSKYEPNHVYSLPLWINQLPAILGSRLSEEVNLDFFENNAIPAMLLLVSGGALTEDSVNDLQKKFNSIKGTNSVQKVLIVEATGDDSAVAIGGTVPTPKLEAKPMTNDRQNDSLFREYNKDNKESIQCTFRLPDVLLGKTADYNRATAYAAIIVAEAQVFNPLRRTIESVINRCIIVDEKGLPDPHWEFVFKPTKLLNEETVFQAIDKGIKSGAATPKDIAEIIRDNFNINIPIEDKDWSDDMPSLALSKGLEIMYNKVAEAGNVLDIGIPEGTFKALTAPKGTNALPKDGLAVYDSEADVPTGIEVAPTDTDDSIG
jgi:PBSX family phage portal protein